jgi:hypothetical protein
LLCVFLSGLSFALLAVTDMLDTRVNHLSCCLTDKLAIVFASLENLQVRFVDQTEQLVESN